MGCFLFCCIFEIPDDFFFSLLTKARLGLTSPFSFLIRRLKSLPSRQIKSSPGWMMPHLAAMALAVLMLSPVTIRTVMPARWHLRMASGTWRQRDSSDFEDVRQKHTLWDHRVSELLKMANVRWGCGTSGLTGSSMPTTVMQVNSVTISASFSHSGSGLDGRSRYAMQIVLRPSHAIGSITCDWFTYKLVIHHLADQIISSIYQSGRLVFKEFSTDVSISFIICFFLRLIYFSSISTLLS